MLVACNPFQGQKISTVTLMSSPREDWGGACSGPTLVAGQRFGTTGLFFKSALPSCARTPVPGSCGSMYTETCTASTQLGRLNEIKGGMAGNEKWAGIFFLKFPHNSIVPPNPPPAKNNFGKPPPPHLHGNLVRQYHSVYLSSRRLRHSEEPRDSQRRIYIPTRAL